MKRNGAIRVVRPDARPGPASERRAGGTLGPRAAWLARIVAQGALGRTGLLRHDLWDPLEGKLLRAADDLAAWREGLTPETGR